MTEPASPRYRKLAHCAQLALDLRVAARKAAAPAAKPSLSVVPDTAPPESREGRATSDIQEVKVTNQTRWRDSVATGVMFVAALALAAVSGTFAVVGLTSIFAGAPMPIVAMGAALEVGKLSAVAWLGRRYAAPIALKAGIVLLIVTLMAFNAVGSYGFLAHAHLQNAVAGEVAIGAHNADVAARTQLQAGVVADIDKRIAQIDGAVAEVIARGRAAAGLGLAQEETHYRKDLLLERARETSKLAALQIDAAAVVGERAQLAADSGPIRYLAALLHVDEESVIHFFILAIALLIDPLALALLLAAVTSRGGP